MATAAGRCEQAAPYLMPQQFDAEAGAMLTRTMEGMGVRVMTGAKTTAVIGSGQVQGVALADGSTLSCEILVISCGIRANIALAHDSGLAVERGILVDDQMRTADPNVFGVGECVQHLGVTYGLVAPLYEQARVLADVVTGVNPNAAYTGSRLATKLKVMGVELASMGITRPRDAHDEVIQYAEPRRGIYKKLILRDGILVGGILLGDTGKAQPLMQSFERATPVPEERAGLLFDLGSSSPQMSLLEMPDDTQVCNCNGVCKGTIRKCVAGGKHSLKAVMETTRAGLGCGSCKALVRELVEWACEGHMEEDPSLHYYVPGVPLAKPTLVEQIKARGLKSVSAVFAALAGGKEDAASKPGLASLLKSVWHDAYEDERDSRFINDRVHANIQKDATFSVVPRMYGGITTPDALRRIADVADKYHVPMVKVTGSQRLDLLGVRKEDLPGVWHDLGMPSGHAYAKAFRTCKTCVGTDFCRYGLGDSTSLGIKIERRFQGIEFPHKVKTAVSGCPRNCAESTIKDIGVVGVEGGWEIYIGGASGSRVRAADLLARVGTHDETLLLIGRFMQYYRENAKYLERTPGLVERLGMEHIRNVIVNDTEGIAARLDAEIQAAQGNGQGGREHGQKADQLPGYRKIDDPAHRAYIAGVWGIPEAEIPGAGKSAYELLDAIANREIRGLLVIGSNPAVSAPNARHTNRGLDGLEFLAVADFFLSETASRADVVFPAAQWAEEDGTVTNLEGRVLLRRRAADPPGEARSDLMLLIDLAARLGRGQYFPYRHAREVFDELRLASKGGIADYSGITWGRIEQEDGVFWPCPEPRHPGTPLVFTERFATPDGRARMQAVRYRPSAEEPDAEYPLRLTTGRVLHHYLSGNQTRRVASLVKVKPEPYAEIHPDVARKHSLKNGDIACLTTRRGSMNFKVRVVAGIRSDTVFVPFHWGGDRCVNDLTNPALDPVSKMPEFKTCALRIDPPFTRSL